MSVITKDEFDKLSGLANGIKDEVKRGNALVLLDSMTQEIDVGDGNPRTWQSKLVKVLQALSSMEKITAENPKDVRAGAMVAGTHLLANGTQMIPLMTWISRSMWNPDQNINRKLCSSPDSRIGWAHGECIKCPFGKSDEPGVAPPCNKEQSFLTIDRDFKDMYRFQFHKSQYRDGMDWSKMIRDANTHPFKRVYSVNGEPTQKNKKVQTIKVTLQDVRENALPADELAFLEALYQKHLGDRKRYLEDYRAEVEQKLNGAGAQVDSSLHLTHEERPAIAGTSSSGGEEGTPNYNL